MEQSVRRPLIIGVGVDIFIGTLSELLETRSTVGPTVGIPIFFAGHERFPEEGSLVNARILGKIKTAQVLGHDLKPPYAIPQFEALAVSKHTRKIAAMSVSRSASEMLYTPRR